MVAEDVLDGMDGGCCRFACWVLCYCYVARTMDDGFSLVNFCSTT